jgi:hypothetical protein
MTYTDRLRRLRTTGGGRPLMTSIYGVRPLMIHRGWSLWRWPLMMPVVLSERSDARGAMTIDMKESERLSD